MALNGTEFINNPFNTTFAAFTDLLGSGFWIIPLSFIVIALYVKTENAVACSAFMIASGLVLSSGNIFVGNIEMSLVFIIFTGIGLVGLFISIYTNVRR